MSEVEFMLSVVEVAEFVLTFMAMTITLEIADGQYIPHRLREVNKVGVTHPTMK
jgi:hypothetical protein